MAMKEHQRYNTKSIKGNFKPESLQSQTLHRGSDSLRLIKERHNHMGMLHVAAGMTPENCREFGALFNGFEVMRLEIISEGANRILKGLFFFLFVSFFFLRAFSSCPVKWMCRTVRLKRIKSQHGKQRAGIYSVFSQQTFKRPGSVRKGFGID